MKSIAITSSLTVPGVLDVQSRGTQCRRDPFGLLARPGNLDSFARLLDWQPSDLANAEVSVEWTFLRDLVTVRRDDRP
jgi:hypothetical protein